MSKEARSYTRVTEAEELIVKMVEAHPDLFWSVRPGQIAVMGVENQERSEKSIAKNPASAKLRLVKGAEKAIFQTNNIPIRYIVEIFWAEWNTWKSTYRQWVLANAIMEITPEEEKRNKKDCVGFKVLLDVSGVNWDRNLDGLPDLLNKDLEFDLDLRPGLDDVDADGDPETNPED